MVEIQVFWVILICCIISAVSAKEDTFILRDKTIVDILLAKINSENISFANDDAPCFNEISSVLNSVQNATLSSMWMLDSMQLPNGVLYGSQYQLGNYDECMNAKNTRYCLVDIKLTNEEPKQWSPNEGTVSVETYINIKTKHGRKLNTMTWGLCLPASCRKNAVSKFSKMLFQISSFGSVFLEPTLHVDHCQVDTKEIGLGVSVFLGLLIVLSIVTILSTWYSSKTKYHNPESVLSKVASSFCINRNALDLVKASSEEIPMLHGMRVLTAIILVYTHHQFFAISGAIGNGLHVDQFIDDVPFLMHTDLMTDTFLMMSALLLARGLVNKQKLENPIMIMWKRYIRLIGPMAIIVFYIAAVSTYVGNGPIWLKLAGLEAELCRKNWWLSLLMFNNYVNSEEMCFISLWYLPADFQLTILGVLLIYLHRYRRRVGAIAVGVAAALSVLLPAYATYNRTLTGTILYNVETMIDIRRNEVFNSTYIRSHYRIGSYLVGLATGYIMALCKPTLHRNMISKKTSIILFILLFIVAWIPFIISGWLYTREYDVVEAALFASSHRIVWTLALSGLVLICEYGELPLVNGLLSWKAWVPLSRLSYGLYLIHPVIIQYNVFSTRTPLRYHPFTMLSDSFGPVVLGYLLSLVMWLLIQAPISNLISCIYSRKYEALTDRSKIKIS